MKLLFSLNHPAHYYLFKYIIRGLRESGHEVKIVIRQKDVLEKILQCEKESYTKINEKKSRKNNAFSIISQGIRELAIQDFNLFKEVKKSRPDFLLGTDICITHIGRLKRIPSFVFNEDDFEINKLFCNAAYPFAHFIVSPEYTSVGSYKSKKIAYNGIQKMAYLSPKYFVPDESVLEELNLSKGDTFFIIRLVSLTAGHDIEGRHRGINKVLLNKLISYLEPKGKVFLTSEEVLSDDLKTYQIKVAPNKIHDLLYFASLFIGDSQSMCSEAGILGTPFIRFNDFVGKIEVLKDLENNYKLGWGVKTNESERIFSIMDELFSTSNYKNVWIERKTALFNDKIDLTAFTIWLVENYPSSVEKLRDNPRLQYRIV